MPVLKDFRATKVLTVPSFPDSKIEVYNSVLVGDSVNIDWANKNQFEVGIQRLLCHIKSWNFVNEDGKPMAVSRENLNFFREDDITYLLGEITKFALETKKK